MTVSSRRYPEPTSILRWPENNAAGALYRPTGSVLVSETTGKKRREGEGEGEVG